MLKKINSFLSASTGTTSTKKSRPTITFKRSSDSAVDNRLTTGLPQPVPSANTVKLYVSYDNGLYSTIKYD